MKNSHSDTLFHYTKSLDTVISILKEGFKVSYSGEQITKDIFIGIPMISFCDIPVELCEEHRTKYGNYAIGISKKALIEIAGGLLSPVHYVMCDEPIIGAYKYHEQVIQNNALNEEWIKDRYSSGATPVTVKGPQGQIYTGFTGCLPDDMSIVKRFFELPKLRDYANFALAFTKNYYCEHNGETFCAYDECEWRIIIPEDRSIDNEAVEWYWSKVEYDNWKSTHGNTFLDICPNICVGPEDVTTIIVKSKEDRAAIMNLIKQMDCPALVPQIVIAPPSLTDNNANSANGGYKS